MTSNVGVGGMGESCISGKGWQTLVTSHDKNLMRNHAHIKVYLSMFYGCEETMWPQKLIEKKTSNWGQLTTPEVLCITIITGRKLGGAQADAQTWCWRGNRVLHPDRQAAGGGRDTRPGLSIGNLQGHHQWHISSIKDTSLPPRPHLLLWFPNHSSPWSYEGHSYSIPQVLAKILGPRGGHQRMTFTVSGYQSNRSPPHTHIQRRYIPWGNMTKYLFTSGGKTTTRQSSTLKSNLADWWIYWSYVH